MFKLGFGYIPIESNCERYKIEIKCYHGDEFPKILLLSDDMPDRIPIGDRHALSETSTFFNGDTSKNGMPHQRPTCLIDNLSETDMLGLRKTYASSETNINA